MNSISQLQGCDALPQVAMDFMNTVHCEELGLVIDLLAALDEGVSIDEIGAKLNAWFEHTTAHFEREERLMQEYQFPPYPIHKREHDQALQTLKSVQSQWQASHDNAALARYIKDDWRPWLQQHISTMDRVTATFFSQFDIQVEL